ncbi:MAG TPA: hypothetical protein VEG27_01885 [Usitatibacter sp.]|nr:hypothetical protein [Usitatibacter sp.]
MKTLLALSASALVFAGCATAPENQYAQNDECKLSPVVTAGPAAQARVTNLDQRFAEMQLATSDLRLRNLQQNPDTSINNLEQSLNGCARR